MSKRTVGGEEHEDAYRKRTRPNATAGAGPSRPFGDLFSGSDFHAKPLSSSGFKKKPTFHVPDQKELYSAFETANTPSRPPQASMTTFRAPRPPPQFSPLTNAVPFTDDLRRDRMPMMVPRPPVFQSARRLEVKTTPMSSRVHRLEIPYKEPVTPARKIVPFHELPFPKLQSPSSENTAELRSLLAPNFTLGDSSRIKTPMRAIAGLDPPNFELDDGEEDEPSAEAVELQRGLMVSPEKGGMRGKKFVRGGLAERAQNLISRSHIAFTLWQKETEVHASSSRSRLRPDIRFQIIEIVHESRVSNIHARSTGTLRSVLARCQVLAAASTKQETDEDITLPERTVVFSFSSQSNDSHLLASGVTMSEGAIVFAWKPIYEIQRASDSSNGAQTPVIDPFLTPPRKATITKEPSRTSAPSTMLISRFLVLHKS